MTAYTIGTALHEQRLTPSQLQHAWFVREWNRYWSAPTSVRHHRPDYYGEPVRSLARLFDSWCWRPHYPRERSRPTTTDVAAEPTFFAQWEAVIKGIGR